MLLDINLVSYLDLFLALIGQCDIIFCVIVIRGDSYTKYMFNFSLWCDILRYCSGNAGRIISKPANCTVHCKIREIH